MVGLPIESYGTGEVPVREVATFLRKKDFKLLIGLEPDSPDLSEELVRAIYLVKPSFVKSDVIIEAYQPIIGSVHGTIMDICRKGLPLLTIHTLIPGHPELSDREDCGQLVYTYARGVVTEHYTQLSRDALEGDNFMLHIMSIKFAEAKILMNEWREEAPVKLSLVPNK